MPANQRRDLSGDIDALKALAHPLRQRLLTRLRRHGPATSAMLAAEFGEDRGATSYHLRQLARYGFLVEDTERSAGRRRYWRAERLDIRLPTLGDSTESDAAVETISALWERGASRERERFEADLSADPRSYGDFGAAAMSSYGELRLTAEELRRFTEEYIALLQRWGREIDDAPPGSRHITALFTAFPTPGPAGPTSTADLADTTDPDAAPD
ncbi:MAG: helix-turn-helix domain-containing protein, partial [Actinocatenispora sp.]